MHVQPKEGGARVNWILIAFAAILLTTAPVIAQDTTATPPAPTSSSLVRDLADAAQTLGTTNVIMLLIVGLVVLVAYRGLSPLLEMLKSFKANNDRLQSDLMTAFNQGMDRARQTADVNERTVNILNSLETKGEAQQSRSNAVEVITKHMDDAHLETRNQIAKLREDVTESLKALPRIEQQIANAGIDGGVKSVLESIAVLLTRIEPLLVKLEEKEPAHESQPNPTSPVPPVLPPAVGDEPNAGERTGSDGNSQSNADGQPNAGHADTIP